MSLRKEVIRLAHAQPELRPVLVPILKSASVDQKEVAMTIFQQLGGIGRLKAMVGAKNFLSGHKDNGALAGASFQFSNPEAGKPNYVKVLLMPDDTYTVTFGRTRGLTYKEGQPFKDIYADRLGWLFERNTGLHLSL